MSAWDEIDRLKAEAMKTSMLPVHRNPKLSPDAARTLRNEQRIARGFHPNGTRLLVPIVAGADQTCGGCAHLREKETGARRTFFKCALGRDTNGPGTDIRKKWPACELWKGVSK